MLSRLLPLIALCATAQALDNGAADLPPLGWCSWQRYRCAIACNDSTSKDCFNERLIRDTADAMAASPLKAAGYEYVALDDCWQAPRRVNGHVVADPHRFPSGMKALADYVHSKGLKFGLYTAVGNFTCASGRFAIDPIGLGCDYAKIPECEVAKRDIDDFVSWDIDHLKVDGCGGFDTQHMNASYAIIGSFLQDAVRRRGTGPVVYHPSNLAFEFPRQLRELASIGNQWRFYNDVGDSWASVAGIMQAIGAGQPECKPGPLPVNCTGRLRSAESVYCASFCVERDEFLRVAGRGGWHDPDMLLVGETPCSAAGKAAGMQCTVLPVDEQKTQMAIWSMASAPLLLSADLTNVSKEAMAILTNAEVLKIDQDPLGRMPFRVIANSTIGVDVWRKDLVGGDVAVAVVNMGALTPAGDVQWLETVGMVYDDSQCTNLDPQHLDGCGGIPAAKVVACCKTLCDRDDQCSAVNVNTATGKCIKRGCDAIELVSGPSQTDPGWECYRHNATVTPLAPGFTVQLADVGFSFNTQVAIKDVFTGDDLGVHVGTFTTTRPIPLHGTLLLRLTYHPQYPASRRDATFRPEL